MKRSKSGGVIDFDHDRLERLVAKGILEGRVPIRGKELKLLRSVVRLSLNKFAHRMGLSYGAIFHWEKQEKERLNPVNEIAVRLLCAEELNIKLPGRFSELLGDARHDPVEVIVTNKKPTPKIREVKEITRPSYRGHRRVKIKV